MNSTLVDNCSISQELLEVVYTVMHPVGTVLWDCNYSCGDIE